MWDTFKGESGDKIERERERGGGEEGLSSPG